MLPYIDAQLDVTIHRYTTGCYLLVLTCTSELRLDCDVEGKNIRLFLYSFGLKALDLSSVMSISIAPS